MGILHTYGQVVFTIWVMLISVQWLFGAFQGMQQKMMDRLEADLSKVDALFCSAVHEKRVDSLPDGGHELEGLLEECVP